MPVMVGDVCRRKASEFNVSNHIFQKPKKMAFCYVPEAEEDGILLCTLLAVFLQF